MPSAAAIDARVGRLVAPRGPQGRRHVGGAAARSLRCAGERRGRRSFNNNNDDNALLLCGRRTLWSTLGRGDRSRLSRPRATAALGETVLFKKANVGADYFESAENKEHWDALADVLSEKLGIEVSSPRIQHYYLPVYLWIKSKMGEHKRSSSSPLCVGLSAPQGCGKTTLVTAFEELFETEGLSCVSMSLDDFYLTRSDQVDLAETHADNDLLQVRGNAGTHDVDLAMRLIRGVKTPASSDAPVVRVPCYDKTAFEGKGDRHDESKWRSYDPSKVDVVLYEGWMQGFTAVEDPPSAIHAGLPIVNDFLKGYSEMWSLMDIWLVIQVKELDCIYKWRLQAETAMKEQFGQDKGMSDEEVKAFVDKYIPAYKAYLPELYDESKHVENLGCEKNEDVFMFEVDATRSPVA